MNNDEAIEQKPEILEHVLGKMLGQTVSRANYQARQLHGGTLGDVRLVTGTAETSDGESLPYRIVWKTQKKWDRYADPDSWRREYDLYTSDLGKCFTGSLRWPTCYHAEINDEEIQLWMEYIDGESGLKLTPGMYGRAAEELGRFQGKLHAQHLHVLQGLNNVSQLELVKDSYLRYRSWQVLYDYIRADDCQIPKHLCQMLIDVDNHADEIFDRIAKLPKVFCHRDFWVENIFYLEGEIVVIDWDTAGWGYMGEDIASLIADEADVCHMVEHYQKCIPAYYRGFAEYVKGPPVSDHCIHELILVMFGYRIVEWYKFADSPADQARHLDTLHKIHEMRLILVN